MGAKTKDRSFHEKTLRAGGSTLDIAEGLDGRPIFVTDEQNPKSKADLACDIIKTHWMPTNGNIDPGIAITNVLSRMAERRYQNVQDDLTLARSQVIVLISFGRIGTDDKTILINAIIRMKERHPGAKLIIVTRWAPITEFARYVHDAKQDIIILHPQNREQDAILDAKRIADRIAKIPGHVTYDKCSGPDYKEYKSEQTLYVVPNTQRTFMLHPRLFHKSEDLKMIFEVKFNSADICWSRKNYDHYLNANEVSDEQCENVNIGSGSTISRKATFHWIDPCNGYPAEICDPIFFRIKGLNSGGMSCFTSHGGYPCKVANAIEIKIKHQGMTCSAFGLTPQGVLVLTIVVLLILQMF